MGVKNRQRITRKMSISLANYITLTAIVKPFCKSGYYSPLGKLVYRPPQRGRQCEGDTPATPSCCEASKGTVPEGIIRWAGHGCQEIGISGRPNGDGVIMW